MFVLCVWAGKGLMRFTPGSIKNETDLMLLTFDDTVWDEVYDKGLSCEKVNATQRNATRHADRKVCVGW